MQIKFGLTNSINRSFASGTTIGQVLSNPTVLAELGAPEGVVAIAYGETLDPSEPVENYDVITLERQATKKG